MPVTFKLYLLQAIITQSILCGDIDNFTLCIMFIFAVVNAILQLFDTENVCQNI